MERKKVLECRDLHRKLGKKEILKGKSYDISRFVSLCSQAFLPKVVFQLEEYGLPRMISKKLQKSGFIDFQSKDLTIHKAIDLFNEIGVQKLLLQTIELDDFNKYTLNYFYEGIKIPNA